MKRQPLGPPPLGNVVHVIETDTGTTLFCDDSYRNNTPEDTQGILNRSAYIICMGLSLAAAQSATGAA